MQKDYFLDNMSYLKKYPKRLQMDLNAYLNKSARGATARLAEFLGDHSSNISMWRYGKKPVPKSKCYPIEQFTDGEVTRKDLRPTDWKILWPELAEK